MPRTLAPEAKAVIGANIRAARENAGYKTQKVAAPIVGVSRSLLNQWESGTYTPDAEGLLRLAVAYRCQLDAFFGGADEGYDAIIERRIPIDAKAHYESKLKKLKALTLVAMELTSSALPPPAPTPATHAASSSSSRGKSGSTRARRARGKS